MPEIITSFFSLPKWAVIIIASFFSYIGYLLVFGTKRYFDASAEFRKVIYTEFEGLYPTPVNWPKNTMAIVQILKEKYPRIEIAVHNFRDHLPFFLIKGFDKAWIRYYNEYEQEGWQSYFQYVPMKGESFSYGEKISEYDNTEPFKGNFKKNIDNLLKYAKQI